MGNCYPCNKFKWYNKESNNYKKGRNSEEIFRIIRSPDEFILYGSLKPSKSNNYFSPNCTKRPIYAKKECKNCASIFYSYREMDYCSNECKFTIFFRNEPEPKYNNPYNII